MSNALCYENKSMRNLNSEYLIFSVSSRKKSTFLKFKDEIQELEHSLKYAKSERIIFFS